VQVDVDASRRAIEPLAERLGMDVHQTAAAIIDVSVSGMYGGVSRIVSRFGIDPRAFWLMPFGGAGPMLGGFLARALNMRHLVVPTTPGVLSALGGLIADTKNDFVRTTYYPLDAESLGKLADDLAMLESQAREWIVGETGTDAGAEMTVSADMRYRGQSFEVDTPLDAQAIRTRDMSAIADAFHREHHRLYGHSDERSAVQVVALRLVISLPTPKPEMPKVARGEGKPEVEAMIDVYLDGAWRTVPMYRRASLLAEHRFDGPAIVTQDDTTTCVLPGFECVVDEYGNLLLSAQ
jgi:N-methylhydantoinase A